MQIERRSGLSANVGIISVGHTTYWKQFDGLLEVMHEKSAIFEQKVQKHSVKVFNFGMVDSSSKAYIVLDEIQKSNLDLLFIHMATYATSATFAPIVQAVDIPMVLVALQPLSAMDYKKATTFMQLSNDDICSVPEFAAVAIRMGKKVPEMIFGAQDGDPAAEEEIASWCRIAHVLHDLKQARFGLMGHVLDTMYDMHVDPALITRTFGSHVVPIEAEDLLEHFTSVDGSAVENMKNRILDFFDTPEPGTDNITFSLKPEDLNLAARCAVALEEFIDQKKLTGLAYYYEGQEGSDMRKLVTNLIVGNSLLTGAGFPMCGEFDLKTCVAMMIMDRLEIGGSFAEFHPMDFKQNSVLVGHDGPHHINIADRKPMLRSLSKYHGKPGSGAGVEFKIKEGPMTMLGITINADGFLKFVVAEGESLQGDIPATGNTNSHGFFKPDLKTFLRNWCMEGPTHHFALGIGHHAKEIMQIARIFDIDAVLVTPQ